MADSTYLPILERTDFRSIVEARLLLPLNIELIEDPILSPLAQQTLYKIDLFSKFRNGDSENLIKAKQVVLTLPAHKGMEPVDTTILKLSELLNLSPSLLEKHLRSKNGNWVLYEEKILEEIISQIEWEFQNE